MAAVGKRASVDTRPLDRLSSLRFLEGLRLSAVVHEFTIHIETPQGTECDGEKAAQVEGAIETRPEITFTATEHSSQSGAISSTFRVRARTVDDAQEIALRAFTAALLVARVSTGHGWLLIEAAGP